MNSRGRWTVGSAGAPAPAGAPTPAGAQRAGAGAAPSSVGPAGPEPFARALAQLRAVRPRREIEFTELPAPQRLAPYSYALGAVVHGDPKRMVDTEIATGRLILLHDPAQPDPWDGDLRLVTYVTAELEPDLAVDPLLAEVGWSWLTEALAAHHAAYTALAGTVTQTTSTRFGDLAGPPPASDVEIRASWTPIGDSVGDTAGGSAGTAADLAAHVLAWCGLLASTAGLPPPGVSALPGRRPGAG